MNIEIVAAGDAEYAIIQNLSRFYVYDMAEHAGYPFEADGSMEIGDHFDPYWGRARANDPRPWPAEWKGFPFLVRVDGTPAGFALVNRQRETPALIDMGEFFIARQYRRHGVGQKVATAMFDRFAGHWEVREMLSNKAAQAFWHRIIADYTKGAFRQTQEVFAQYGGNEFVIQRFVSPPEG